METLVPSLGSWHPCGLQVAYGPCASGVPPGWLPLCCDLRLHHWLWADSSSLSWCCDQHSRFDQDCPPGAPSPPEDGPEHPRRGSADYCGGHYRSCLMRLRCRRRWMGEQLPRPGAKGSFHSGLTWRSWDGGPQVAPREKTGSRYHELSLGGWTKTGRLGLEW